METLRCKNELKWYYEASEQKELIDNAIINRRTPNLFASEKDYNFWERVLYRAERSFQHPIGINAKDVSTS